MPPPVSANDLPRSRKSFSPLSHRLPTVVTPGRRLENRELTNS
ncbi:hypothetical protein TIFTF001_019890 [Ficus carica]|uniref:Uncharacterized protein n=1 Tax=Ficus carica TaxID=3494 RepID=A0AA88A7H4_FICCA|nr:hypothetical protein TIFTF001_019890 [Ficus carica]